MLRVTTKAIPPTPSPAFAEVFGLWCLHSFTTYILFSRIDGTFLLANGKSRKVIVLRYEMSFLVASVRLRSRVNFSRDTMQLIAEGFF